METRLLKYFSVLAEELHFGKAAERLHISQPPLSRQIKDLEEALGVKLFDRTKRNVQLTEYGRYLKDESSKLFNQMDIIRNHLKLMKDGVSGQVKISYVGDFMYSILPDVLSDLRAEYPNVHTVLFELDTESQVRALVSGEVDIGFLRTPIEAKDLAIKPIYEETFSLVLSNSHPLAADKRPPLEALADEPYIGLSPECTAQIRNSVIKICSRAGFYPNITHRISEINSIIKLVMNDLGYSIIPSGIRDSCRDCVKFFELADYPERAELSIAYNPKRLDDIAARVIDLVIAR